MSFLLRLQLFRIQLKKWKTLQMNFTSKMISVGGGESFKEFFCLCKKREWKYTKNKKYCAHGKLA